MTDKLKALSQVTPWHLSQGAVLSEADDVVVDSYTTSTAESAAMNTLALVDLSLLTRSGYKGATAPDFLQSQLSLPRAANQAVTHEAGLVASLSNTEFMLVDSPQQIGSEGLSVRVNASYKQQKPARVYDLPRQDSHCLFGLAGEHSIEMLAKLCGVDFRAHKFAQGEVAQTSIARISGIIIRLSEISIPAFYILCESPSALYLWECLLDAMREFDGQVCGHHAWSELGR